MHQGGASVSRKWKSSIRKQRFNVRFNSGKAAEFGAAHGGAARRRVIIGAGKMVETVCDVECEFSRYTGMLRTLFNSAVDVDNQVAGAAGFAGDRIVPETDDISGTVFTEKFTVGLRNAGIVGK